MLRFSDSMVGAISIAFMTKASVGRNPEVKHLSPLTHRVMEYMSLAQRITTSPDLKHINVILTARPEMPSVSLEQLIAYAASEPVPTRAIIGHGYTPHMTVMLVADGDSGIASLHSLSSSPLPSPTSFGVDQEFTALSPTTQLPNVNESLFNVEDICEMLDEVGATEDTEEPSVDGVSI